MDFVTLLRDGVVYFDGGFGTMAAARGLSAATPEALLLSHPQEVEDIHRAYVEAGAQVIETDSLGGNALKLREHSLEDRCEELATLAVRRARAAAGDRALVAYSVGTTGQFLYPLGTLRFADAVLAYRRPMETARDVGADLIILETFTDIGDMRAALLAAALLGLPVVASYAFEAGGRLLTGGLPECAALAAGALGAAALGINCSTGPADMLPLLGAMRSVSPLPVVVQPNAGLPELTAMGETVFSLSDADMLPAMATLVKAGAAAIGGCCGTTPASIRAFREHIGKRPAPAVPVIDTEWICSQRELCSLAEALADHRRVTLLDADISPLYDLREESAVLLDLSALTPEEAEEAVLLAQMATGKPLLFAAKNTQVAEAALRVYHGKTAVEGPEALAAVCRGFGALFLV